MRRIRSWASLNLFEANRGITLGASRQIRKRLQWDSATRERANCRGAGYPPILKKINLECFSPILAVFIFALSVCETNAAGDAEKGGRALKQQCLSCHSLDKGRHMTGPSLADVIGRKAGAAEGFDRYSDAMKASGIVWSATTMDAFLARPRGLISGTTMQVLIDNADVRADIVAYLVATQGPADGRKADLPVPYQANIDLKSFGAASRVSKIAYCRDTYSLTMQNGATQKFWERNLRFKTDSSKDGPAAGKPVLIPSGQLGDRAYLVFAAPADISASIVSECNSAKLPPQ